MFWLTNTRLHQRKPSATFRSHVLRGQFALPNPTGTGKDGMNHYRHLPYTRNTETRPPEMHSDWSASVDMEGYLQLCWFLSEEFTSYSQHRQDDIAPTIPISRPRTQAWVSHGVSCLRNHILAWNVTFLVLARFTVSSGDQFLNVCGFFRCKLHVDCAPVTLWICCHGGYWGMVHWLCIWNSQVEFFLNQWWYDVL